MGKMFDVMVAGHLCLDLLPQMDHIRLNDLTPGHLFETGPMRFSTGGAVSNTGLALHRLGMNVRLMSNVGDDLIGQMIVAFLEGRDPLLAQYIRAQKGSPSAYTVVLSPEKTDRIFLHCTGTNATFTSFDINYDEAARAKIFHLGYPPLLPALAGCVWLMIITPFWHQSYLLQPLILEQRMLKRMPSEAPCTVLCSDALCRSAGLMLLPQLLQQLAGAFRCPFA